MANHEIWKEIKGYEDRYKVSNKSRIKSLMKWHGNRLIKRKDTFILKQHVSKVGYYAVNLKDGESRRTMYVHRIVAKAFIPNPKNKPQVNHINGIKTDNRLSNLEWVTDSENKYHAHSMGLFGNYDHNVGESHGCAKLTKNDVLNIRNAYRLGCFTYQEIADAYSVDRSTIGKLINKQNWSHI